LLAVLVLLACAPQSAAQAQPAPTRSPAISPNPSPAPIPSHRVAANSHVFVIVMENRGYDQAMSGRYTASLAQQFAVATNYHAVAYPSLPNYLALTSGETWGVADDGYHRLPEAGLGAQLTAAGIAWRAYMEGMTGSCMNSPYPYALKHNPFAYYGSSCPPEVVSFTHFNADMAGTVPHFVWITPDLCHDGHDCPTAVADAWLAQTVPKILATSAWKDDGLLLITWDEGYNNTNHVLTLVIRPNAVLHKSSRLYDHYSLLATIQDYLGVKRLGLAAHATPMNDLSASWPLLVP
jgi:phospholipase C